MAGKAFTKISTVTLKGAGITLEPLRQRHLVGLHKAAQSADIWTYMAANLADRKVLERWHEDARRLEKAGQQLTFAIRLTRSAMLIGSTRYLNIAPEHRRLEIGWTWLAPTEWGSRANTAAKLLLFQHAFEKLGAGRVELRTDALNVRARAAIARLGANEEGVLHRHMVMAQGRVRDTVQFAVIDEDWPRVKKSLKARLKGRSARSARQ